MRREAVGGRDPLPSLTGRRGALDAQRYRRSSASAGRLSSPDERGIRGAVPDITSDSHAGLPTEAYRPYLEKKYHAAFDQFLSERGIQLEMNLGVRNSASPILVREHARR